MIFPVTRAARAARRLGLALVAAFLASAMASSASAQEPIPPPKHEAVDANGVDLISGSLSVPVLLNSIGPNGPGGLSATRTLGIGYSISSMFSYVKLQPIGEMAEDATTLVSFMGRSQEFDATPEVEPKYNEGNRLERDATHFIYTLADGTVARFGIVQLNPNQAVPKYGLLQSVVYPTGEVLDFTYGSQTMGPGWVQVESSLGYVLTGSGGWHEWDVWSANLTESNCAAAFCSGGTPFASQEHASVLRAPTKTSSEIGAPTITVTIHNPAGGTPRIYTIGGGSGRPPRVISMTDGAGTWTYSYTEESIPDSASYPGDYILVTTASDHYGNKRVVRSRASSQKILSDKVGVKPEGTLGDTTVFDYGDSAHPGIGQLKTIVAPEGNWTRYVYDNYSNIIEKWQLPKGTPLTDDPNFVAGATVVRASYDLGSNSLCAKRNICNRPTWIRDERNNQTDFTYDPLHGGVLTITKPAADNGVRPQTRFTYGQFNALYLKNGVLTAAPAAVWRLTQTSTCITGGPAVGTTPAPCVGTADERIVSYAYEPSNVANNVRLLSTTTRAGDNSLSATVASTYNTRGDVVSVDGPLPGTADTTRTYYDDKSRWVTGVIGPDPDGAGALQPRATRTTYAADGLATLVETGNATNQSDTGMSTFASAQSAVTAYDSQRRRSADSLVVGGVTRSLTQYGYDLAGRPICETVRMNPAAFASPPGACALGTQGADGPDRITYSEFDAAGRVTKVTSGYGTSGAYAPRVEKKYAYRPNGTIGLITDGANNTTSLTYDGFDRLTYTHYPAAAVGAQQANGADYDLYSYDPAGNRTGWRRRDGSQINYTFDALNRVTHRTGGAVQPGQGVQGWYHYDNDGRPTITYAASADRVTANYYDPLGRPTATYDWRGDAWRRTSYEWHDLAGRRTALQWADDFYVNYTRDMTGAVTQIHENGAGILAAYGYDNLGRRLVAYRVNGANSFYGYDPAGRLETLTLDLAGSAQDQSYSFAYNPAGQLKSRTAGNAAYEWAGAQTTKSYTVDGLNRYLIAGSASLAYGDNRGNVTGDGSSTFAYDLDNRLISKGGGSAMTLTYDPQGRLDATVAGATTTRLGYSGVDLIEETNAANVIQRRYVPGPNTDEPLAWYEGAGTSDRRFLLGDERGSIVAVTNGSGAWAGAAPNTYDEYGIPAAGNLGRYQYTGQTWIPELGLYHYKARVYSPTLGRFLQTDPIGYKDGLNWYAYVDNDPLNRSDPTGLAAALSGSSDAAKTLANDINALMKKDSGSVTAKMKDGGTITISKNGGTVTIKTETSKFGVGIKVSMTGSVSETKSGEVKLSNLSVSGSTKTFGIEKPMKFSSSPNSAKILTDPKSPNHLFMYRDAPTVVKGFEKQSVPGGYDDLEDNLEKK